MQDSDIKFLKITIKSVKGVDIKKGLAFVIKTQAKLIHTRVHETCLIYVDNGQDFLEEFDQHIVYKADLHNNYV